jgi:hypothetical protein
MLGVYKGAKAGYLKALEIENKNLGGENIQNSLTLGNLAINL